MLLHCCCCHVEALAGSRHVAHRLGLLRFLRLFRLARLLRLLKLDEWQTRLEERFDVNLAFLRLVAMLLKLIFLAHLLACFWFYTAAVVGLDEGIATWVSSYDDGSALSAPPRVQYLYSMYWALTTLTTVHARHPPTPACRISHAVRCRRCHADAVQACHGVRHPARSAKLTGTKHAATCGPVIRSATAT